MTKINLIIEAGDCNGVLDLHIFDSKNSLSLIPRIEAGMNDIEFQVETPNKLCLKVSGKNPRDTIVDPATHKIVQDKYLKIVDILIEDKPIDRNKVQQMFLLDSEKNGKINTSYWGFNGMVHWNLDHRDALDLHLAHII